MWWDKDLAARLQEMSIIQKMNKRYVDDINMVIQVAPDGLRYRNAQIFKDEGAVEEDKGISEDERTITFILRLSLK